jgi:peptidoglycan/LPS O-acetylase OafA/YrhL
MSYRIRFISLADSILRSYHGTNRATYLRALAAIGVLIIHYDGMGLRSCFSPGSLASNLTNNLVDFGGQGPTIFFVASGFVLQKVYQSHNRFWNFLLTRYFRLAPAYIIVSIFAIYTQKLIHELSLLLVIKKILFLDIFFKDAYSFNPIGIGFFVVIEFWFTLVLGVYNLTRMRDGYHRFSALTIGFILSSLLVSYLSGTVISALGLEPFFADFFKFQAFFLMGALTYDLKTQHHFSESLQLALAPLVFSTLFLENYLGYIAASISMLFLITEQQKTGRKPIKFFIAIGNICFSIYLLHIPILRVFELNAVEFDRKIIAIVVLLVSVIMYLTIEVPFVRLGKKLLKSR